MPASQPSDARLTLATPPMPTTLADHFRLVRAETLRFTEPLSPEDLMVQSSPEASPVKWHLAHSSWFFETFVLSEFLDGYQPFNPDFRWLFNSYYNSLGEMPEKKLRASFSRPPLEEILRYRHHVDAAMERLLATEGTPEDDAEVTRRVGLGLEHEQQHLELIATDVKHALWTNPLRPAYLPAPAAERELEQAVRLTFSKFNGGLVDIGITPDPSQPADFAFDNETPQHPVFLQPFALANRLVTAGEYLAFINDNGYSRPELWLSEGWSTMRAAGWQAPLYWVRDPALAPGKSGWSVYTLHGMVPLDTLLATPVCHLSYFEADAFARWSAIAEPGCRLPTEFEWEHACKTLALAQVGDPPRLTVAATAGVLGTMVIAYPANLLETAALHPTASGPGPGPMQMLGDVWEWTASPYTGYPGYRALPGALGEYNGKFMSSQVILRGGSCVTPQTHIRPTYRNFFPPSTRWQFSGLRLAKDAA